MSDEKDEKNLNKKHEQLEEIRELLDRLNGLVENVEEEEGEEEWMTEEQIAEKREAEWSDFVWEQKRKKLERTGPIRIWLTDDVTEGMNDTIVKEIREAADYPERDIELYVSTFGGSVYAAFSICDAILAVPNHVKTIGMGKIMSAGGPILCCGNERIMTESSYLMIHDIWSGTFGSPSEMEANLEHVKDLRKTVVKYFTRFSDIEEEAMMEILLAKKDSFFSAQQALEMGIIDKIEEFSVSEE